MCVLYVSLVTAPQQCPDILRDRGSNVLTTLHLEPRPGISGPTPGPSFGVTSRHLLPNESRRTTQTLVRPSDPRHHLRTSTILFNGAGPPESWYL